MNTNKKVNLVVVCLVATVAFGNAHAFGNGGSSHARAAAIAAQGQVGVNKQRQGQIGINTNKNNNSSAGGKATQGQIGINKNANNVAGSKQQQGQVGIVRDGDQKVKITDNSSVTDNSVYEAQKRNPVNTAWAAPLVAAEDTCMGSASAGGQGVTFGLSIASTWSDSDCVIRKDARFLHNAKRGIVALSLMCEKESVIRAVARAGTQAEKEACGIVEEVKETSADAASTESNKNSLGFVVR